MKIIEQSCEWIQKPNLPLETIEKAARTCYKSEDKITKGSAEKIVKMLKNRGHHAMLEFNNAIVKFITNRGVTHELVRHRLCSFAQESTRYVNYNSKDMEFIRPVWWNDKAKLDAYEAQHYWENAMLDAEKYYNDLIKWGWKPQQAREVLPNSLKTEICVNANLREWMHVFKLRTSKAAHPQIRELMKDCLKMFKEEIPILFDDIED